MIQLKLVMKRENFEWILTAVANPIREVEREISVDKLVLKAKKAQLWLINLNCKTVVTKHFENWIYPFRGHSKISAWFYL